jgi:hypothetical protein
MEEILLAILAADKPKAAIRDHALDRSSCHSW